MKPSYSALTALLLALALASYSTEGAAVAEAGAEAEPQNFPSSSNNNAGVRPGSSSSSSSSSSGRNSGFGGSSASWETPLGINPDLYSRTSSNQLWDCYNDWRLRDRFMRVPQSMDNLIGLIRKIENYPQAQNWDMEKTAAIILKRFRLDGIFFRPADRNSGNDMALLYEGRPHEERKMSFLYKLGPDRNANEFPEDALTPEEKCGLHFMLSYTHNDTARPDENDRGSGGSSSSFGRRKRGLFFGDDEEEGEDDFPSDDGQNDELGKSAASVDSAPYSPQGIKPDVPLRDDSEDSSPLRVQPLVAMSQQQAASARQVAPTYPTSRYPLEMGVVYTPYGTVAAGAVLAGIAYGLEEQSLKVETLLPLDKNLEQLPNEMRQAMIINYYAATVAGDIAQSAITKASLTIEDSKLVGPLGRWNDTVLPTEYSLDVKLEDTSFCTYAEILGGMDGLLLARRIRDWDKSYVKLSHILEMYYSPRGVTMGKLSSTGLPDATGQQVKFRACDRFQLFKDENIVKKTEFEEQIKAFSYLIHAHQFPMWSQSAMDTANKLADRVTKLFWKFVNDDGRQADSNNWECGLDYVSSSSSSSNNQKFFDDDINEPFETKLDIHAMLDSNTGDMEKYAFMYGMSQVLSKLQVNTFGTNEFGINMTQNDEWTCFLDLGEEANKAMIAHKMLRADSWGYSGKFDVRNAMNAIRREYSQFSREEYIENSAGTNGKVFLLVVPKSKPVTSDNLDEKKMEELFEQFFDDLPDIHVIVLGTGSEWQRYLREEKDFISMNGDFAPKLLKRLQQVPGRLLFPRCKDGKEFEGGNHKYEGVYTPGTKALLAYNPHYFFSSGTATIKVQFKQKFPVEVCARRHIDERDTNNVDMRCGKSLDMSDSSVTFEIKPKCGRRNCDPIYITIQTDPAGDMSAYSPACTDYRKCAFPDQVEFEVTHERMRCNGSVSIAASLLTIIGAVFFSMFGK